MTERIASWSAHRSVTGGELDARLDAPVVGKQRASGRAEGDSFTVSGTFKSILTGKLAYTIDGSVEGDLLTALLRTDKGNLEITGVRV